MHAPPVRLTSKGIDGPEAYRIGLVNEVVENSQLKNRAIELSLELTTQPPIVMR